ncbi:MAG: hypothetical protein CMB67_04335 [Euryarchaeota archaeon]|nr:hypothetical protein [Euryarchaeota archaeon]|tara:strand:- start:2726 stop:3214 length:489 start_codon:yes stop_codon:yes gene_type:complete
MNLFFYADPSAISAPYEYKPPDTTFIGLVTYTKEYLEEFPDKEDYAVQCLQQILPAYLVGAILYQILYHRNNTQRCTMIKGFQKMNMTKVDTPPVSPSTKRRRTESPYDFVSCTMCGKHYSSTDAALKHYKKRHGIEHLIEGDTNSYCNKVNLRASPELILF